MKAHLRTLSMVTFPLLAILSSLLLASSAAAAPQAPYFQRFDVDIALQQNGDFIVTENQTVAFGSQSAHHGFRTIPMDRVEQITGVTVFEQRLQYQQAAASGLSVKREGDTTSFSLQIGNSGQETPNSYKVEQKDGNLNVDWWFPPTANAARSFTVRYRVVGGLRYYPGGDQLYWKAVYADRSLLVDSPRVTVRSPADLPSDKVKMASYPERLGVQGRLADPRTVLFEARSLPAETGLEVRVQFPHGLVAGQPPSWQAGADRADWFRDSVKPPLNVFLALVSLLMLVLGTLWIFMRWYSRGRDPAVGGVPALLSEPPGDLPPAVAGTLVDEMADVQDVVATLVDLARRGLLRIAEEDPSGHGKGKREFRLEKLRDEPDDLRGYERLVFRNLFAGDQTVRFDELRKRFLKSIPEVQDQLYQEVVGAGLFQGNPKSVRNRYLIIGGVAMGVGIAFSTVAFFFIDLLELGLAPFVALSLLGGIQMAAAIVMPRRSAMGAVEAARWRAFARYLKQHQSEQEVASRLDRFDPYLPYAVALGAEKEWVKKFAEAGAPAPGWYESYGTPRRGGGHVPYYMGSFSHTGMPGDLAEAERSLQGLSDSGALSLQSLSDGLVDMLNSASRSIAPSSSGSGGWSGGGGGGGGGGGSGGFN